LKCLKANIHAASSHIYPLNLPTRFREDPVFFCSSRVRPLVGGLDSWIAAGREFAVYETMVINDKEVLWVHCAS
jgi:hypothetical protein